MIVWPREIARLAELYEASRTPGVTDETAMRKALEHLATERNPHSQEVRAIIARVEAAVGMQPGDLSRRQREVDDSGHQFKRGSNRALAYWLLHKDLDISEIAASLGRSYHGIQQTLSRFGERLRADAGVRARLEAARARLAAGEQGRKAA